MKELKIGKRNNTFQHVVTLKNNRNKRYETREVFVEGVRNINLALKYGWRVKHWIYNSFLKLSDWGKEVVEKNKTAENFCFVEELLSEISGKSDTSELMAIFEIKQAKIEVKNKNPLIVLFDRPSKKGNLGSVIRSADAFGVDGIIVTGHAVDIYDPEVIGASMGSYFTMPIEKIDTNEEVLKRFQEIRANYPDLQVVSTTELGEKNINEIDYSVSTILMIGNESKGLSKFLLDVSDIKAKIPMVGEASSFNAACAGSIFMYEAFINRKSK